MYKPKIVDMARPVEKEKIEETVPEKYEGPRYPYGLCIHLCEEELEKLGVDFENLEVGSSVSISGMANITEKSSSENANGKPSKRIELQITHLGIDAGSRTESENRAEGRYKGSEK